MSDPLVDGIRSLGRQIRMCEDKIMDKDKQIKKLEEEIRELRSDLYLRTGEYEER